MLETTLEALKCKRKNIKIGKKFQLVARAGQTITSKEFLGLSMNFLEKYSSRGIWAGIPDRPLLGDVVSHFDPIIPLFTFIQICRVGDIFTHVFRFSYNKFYLRINIYLYLPVENWLRIKLLAKVACEKLHG